MGPRSIKSAERTLGLFELFSRCQEPLTVGEVTRGLRIPQPSASMLLSNLADLGYLEYNRVTRTYAPSIRVVLLGSWIGRRFSEAESLATHLGELHRRVGETAYIGIQNGASAQYVLAQMSGAGDKLNVDSGQMRSLTCSAMGRVLLALKSDAEIAGWVRRCNAEATSDRFKVQESSFADLIASVRRNEFAETRGDVTPGLGAMAVHIPSPMGSMPLAIGCGGPITRMEAKREEVLDALRDFQRAVGSKPSEVEASAQ